ncbi:MAG TPA: butyrate kinase [Sediminispirochaeta sp.]|nr:butyrate kinase [Sediminispirochaeta sp.]
MSERVLVINPGSTSTKIAVFEGSKEILNETIRHDAAELSRFESITDQYDFRSDIIKESLSKEGIAPDGFDAVIGRGGLLKPIPGGVWEVNEKMRQDLRRGVSGQHASNLGGLIAHEIAEASGAPSLIADPVVVDELHELARLSGHPELPRMSIFHALNQKAVARRAAEELGQSYEETSFIVAHMGGGVSVGAHKNGRVIDVNNALNGEGPFSPERSGTLPAGQLVELCFSGTYEKKQIMKMLKGQGGFMAYLGTADGREVEERASGGDKEAQLVFEAMAYQVAKEIGALSTVLRGRIDGIILTGGLAYSEHLNEMIKERVAHLGKVLVYPGEGEIEALRDAALRVLRNETKAQEYE